MARKISDMTPAGALDGDEIVPVVRADDSVNYRTTVASIAPVRSVNGDTGAVVLNTDDVAEGATNLYLTQARLRTTVESDSDTTYDFSLADAASKWKMLASASPVTATIPPQASVPWPADTYIEVCQGGAGTVTLAPGSGVTLSVNAELSLVLNGQYAVTGIKLVGLNSWIAFGNLVPAA